MMEYIWNLSFLIPYIICPNMIVYLPDDISNLLTPSSHKLVFMLPCPPIATHDLRLVTPPFFWLFTTASPFYYHIFFAGLLSVLLPHSQTLPIPRPPSCHLIVIYLQPSLQFPYSWVLTYNNKNTFLLCYNRCALSTVFTTLPIFK